ncbi:hypothetical protein HPB49_008709 [Dermacentor silvarum]|uniref:Uncharacterized protein n=1 Tax=Dermacentor silvarum TaxID=543639 RepID=A0ACB8DND6_DERSI|nr:hypothetical protein HPB49_008709 [Dermacentor silvarum]
MNLSAIVPTDTGRAALWRFDESSQARSSCQRASTRRHRIGATGKKSKGHPRQFLHALPVVKDDDDGSYISDTTRQIREHGGWWQKKRRHERMGSCGHEGRSNEDRGSFVEAVPRGLPGCIAGQPRDGSQATEPRSCMCPVPGRFLRSGSSCALGSPLLSQFRRQNPEPSTKRLSPRHRHAYPSHLRRIRLVKEGYDHTSCALGSLLRSQFRRQNPEPPTKRLSPRHRHAYPSHLRRIWRVKEGYDHTNEEAQERFHGYVGAIYSGDIQDKNQARSALGGIYHFCSTMAAGVVRAFRGVIANVTRFFDKIVGGIGEMFPRLLGSKEGINSGI